MCRYRLPCVLLCFGLLAAPMRAAAVDAELGDPTRPPAVRPAAVDRAHPLILSAIYWAPERPAAVIDGRRVGLGAGVGAFVVEAIERDAVRLRGASGFVELRLAARVRRARGEGR